MKSRLLLYHILSCCHVAFFVAARPASSTSSFRDLQEAAEILVTNRNILEEDRGETSHRLIGSFSTVGTNYETGGDIVQVSSFRACDARRKGLDHTVFEHVSVVFVDDVQPFLTGCVALDNQARFAEKSGAMALVVGPASRVEKTLRPQFSTQAKIPIIVLNDTETLKLRQLLDVAQGSMIKLRINFAQPENASKILKLQVFRPTLLNICLIGLLVVLVIFVSLLVVIKIRCQPSMHRELWLRALARTALAKMETRHFSKEKKREKRPRPLQKLASASNSSYFAVFGSLTSVAASSSNSQERCVICLEEYEEGTELRVLFCGHEFHPKCVDPWLLSRRRCPLCQFDVVYKHYPIVDDGEKVETPNSDTSSLLPPPNPPSFLHSEMNPNRVRLTRPLPRRVPRARSCPRRRQLRSRNQLEFRNRLGGYSSDVSSSHFEQCV